MHGSCSGAGIVTDTIDNVSRVYADALKAVYVFEMSKMGHWRQLYAWSKQVRMIVSLTDKVNPYLHHIKARYDKPIVGVRFSQWHLTYDYDALYESWQIGWGVDKKQYAGIAANRRPKRKPVFHMLGWDQNLLTGLQDLGYQVRTGPNYYLGDIALEPTKVIVPTRMYAAAASGMPVVSIKENEQWTKVLGAYDYLFLDESLEDVVYEVCKSDFLYAGMIAVDMVPDLLELKANIRELLKYLRTS